MSDLNNQNGFNSNYPPNPPQAPPMPNGYNPQAPKQYAGTRFAQPEQAPQYNPPRQPEQVPQYNPPQQPEQAPQYNPPQQPEQAPQYNPPRQPEQAPQYTPPRQPEPRPPFNPPPAPTYIPPQAPPYAPQPPYASAQPPYAAPVNSWGRPPMQPHNPPKQSMSGGLKALIITLSVLLVGSLTALIAVVASNNSAQSKPDQSSKSDSGYETPTNPYYNPYDFFDFGDDDEDEDEAPAKESYEQSDAKDKTDKDFAGLKLNKKPSSGKSGASYAFNSVEKSVVGVICYVDGQEGTSADYSVMGTGIVLTKDGYIVTNAHIINNSRTSYLIKIVTNDKKEYDAGVVGYDSRSDIAVLKAEAKGLTPATFGDSGDIEIAEDVIVVGNPLSLDYQNSVTKGIVSAVDRQVSISNNVRCIQTDAAINPGNSGGPLCNMYGQVIGLASSKIALDNYEAMCFAIPSQRIKAVADDVIRYSFVRNRVKIGIIGEVKYISEGRGTAIQIKEISKGGPMDGSGAKVGDYVTEVDGVKVANFAEIYDVLENYRAGDKVKITVYRQSKDKEYEFTVKLQADEP